MPGDMEISQTGSIPINLFVSGEVSSYVLNPLLISTLSQSEQQALVSSYGASTPILFPPSSVENLMALGQAKMVNDLLDGWQKNLQEQADRIREEQMSPRFRAFKEAIREQVKEISEKETIQSIFQSAEYHSWLQTLSPMERTAELNFVAGENSRAMAIDGLTHFTSRPGDATALITLGVVIGAGGISEALMVDTSSTHMVGVNPVADASQVAMATVPPNLHEALNLSINLFVTGLVYQSTGEVLAQNPNKAPKDAEYGETFAKGILALVKSDQINGFIMAICVNKFENGQPISADRATQLAQTAKAVMLMIALAVLYQTSTGWLSGQELLDLIDGKMEPQSEVEADLVKNLGGLLDSLPADTREILRDGFASYMDSRPNIETLLSPKKAADALFTHVAPQEQKG